MKKITTQKKAIKAPVKKRGSTRDRRQSDIPVFKIDNINPRLEHAKIDRFKLGIKKGFLLRFTSQNAFGIFLARLGESQVFFNDQGKHRFKTRAQRLNVEKRWLFNAELNIFKNSDPLAGPLEYIVSLNLDLNLTRFLNHLITNVGFKNAVWFINRVNSLSCYDLLEASLDTDRLSHGLDNQTNLINEEHYRALRPTADFHEIYVQAVFNLIEEELSVAMSCASRTLRANSVTRILTNWYFSHLEVYWEYKTENAIAFVKSFHQKYMPKLNSSEIAYYRLGEDEPNQPIPTRLGSYGLERNAPVSTLRIGKDLDIVVYGKKIDRVRFEVRLKRNVREILRLSSSSLPNAAQNTSVIVDHAIAYAHKKISKLFSHFPATMNLVKHEFMVLANFAGAVDLFANESGLSKRSVELFSQLAVNRAITVDLGSPEHNFCEKLLGRRIVTKAKVARNIDGSRRYTLSASYAGVLYKLQGIKY